MFAAIHWNKPDVNVLHSVPSGPTVFDCAMDFSPLIERTSPGTVTLDVSGLARLFGSFENIAQAIARRAAEIGLDVNVGAASNPDAAVHAARGFSGVTVIPPGRERDALGPLSVDVLAPPEPIAATLAMWGIRTFAQLAALPEDGIAERLGPEGALLWKLARGAGDRPLVPDLEATIFAESFELEYPVTLLEPLAFIISRMLNSLCAKLDSHGFAAHEIRVTLRLEADASADPEQQTGESRSSPEARFGGSPRFAGIHERTLRLPYPMRDARAFLKLITLDLDMHPPSAPVIALSLAMEPVNPRVLQHGLFVPLAPEPQKLELTLARIQKLVGEGKAGAAELPDTHRPGAFVMHRFAPPSADARPKTRKATSLGLAVRIFRPALAARVYAPMGRPARLEARGIRGTVVASAGPWRTSGAWWREDPWARDEWDIALSDGALYRVYRDYIQNKWFVEGAYD